MPRLLVIMVAALAGLGGAAFAMRAVQTARSAGAPFVLTVVPDHQTAVRGRALSVSVTVERAAGFSGPITLATTRLPRGMRARWQLADGTRSAVVPEGENGATLTVATSAAAPLGRRVVTVRARAGETTAARTLVLTIKAPRLRRFSVSAVPARRVVAQGGSAVYSVRLRQARGFDEPILLKVLGLPRGLRASFTRGPVTRLTVRTSARQRIGSERLVIYGRSWVGGRKVHRYAVVVLSVVPARNGLSISGDLTAPLFPGGRGPLDLVLTNPNRFEIRVNELAVSAGPATSQPACSADVNYAIEQYSGPYPLLLGPGQTRLSALVADSSRWPQLTMRDLPTNQDACKGARLALKYAGTAIG